MNFSFGGMDERAYVDPANPHEGYFLCDWCGSKARLCWMWKEQPVYKYMPAFEQCRFVCAADACQANIPWVKDSLSPEAQETFQATCAYKAWNEKVAEEKKRKEAYLAGLPDVLKKLIEDGTIKVHDKSRGHVELYIGEYRLDRVYGGFKPSKQYYTTGGGSWTGGYANLASEGLGDFITIKQHAAQTQPSYYYVDTTTTVGNANAVAATDIVNETEESDDSF
jgi:hypothetical protein